MDFVLYRLQTYFSGWNLNDFLTQAATDRGELLYSLWFPKLHQLSSYILILAFESITLYIVLLPLNLTVMVDGLSTNCNL